MNTNVKINLLIMMFLSCITCLTFAEMVGYYDFNHQMDDELIVDRIGGNDATIPNGGVFLPSKAGSNNIGFGNAVFFGSPGSHAIIDSCDLFSFGRDDFTISGWIKIPNVGSCSSGSYGMIIYAGIGNQGGINLWIGPCHRTTRGKLGFDVKGTNSLHPEANLTLTSDNRIDDNEWHWFATIVENEAMYMYIDGVEQFASGFPVYEADTLATPPVEHICSLGDNLLSGMIDDLRIYNTALSRTVDINFTLTSGELYSIWTSAPEVSTCNDAIMNGYGYRADLNADCKVDLEDLTIFAVEWLKCNIPGEIGCETPWLN